MNTYRVTYIYRPKEEVFRMNIQAKSATSAARQALDTFKQRVYPMPSDDHLWIHKSTTISATQLRMAL